MNKHLYRLIFSKSQQRLVVVSEIATREGKAKGEGGQSVAEGMSRFTLGKGWQLSAVNLGLVTALGFLLVTTAAANELQIHADQSAAKNQQAIILQTANGLPQVNIQTPNDKGLSHNKYQQFDVDSKGVILNNSRTEVQTEQGGWVQGNPYLARGEAKVILNEVNSNNPSQLKGYVEVAGKRAEVIIANPSGIHCEGCGTINAGRTTLTTGKVELENGMVKGYHVEQGKVTVSGRGMDTSRSDYTDIIARETEINAGIWAKELKVTTGKNTVSADNQAVQVIHKSKQNGTEQPTQDVRYAVDVSELGGMYAGKIHLVGTEDGLGVRNAGHIGATQGHVQIDSKGQIVNSGFVGAQQDVKVTAKQALENHGTVYAQQGDVQLQSQTQGIKQHGSVIAKGDSQGKGKVRLQAKGKIAQQGETLAESDITYQAKQIETEKTAVLAAGVRFEQTENGERKILNAASENGKNLTLSAEQRAVAQGQNLASGKLQVSAETVNLNHSQTSGYDVDVQASKGNASADNAMLSTVKNLTISTPTALSTQGSQLTAERIKTTQTDLFNQKGIWRQTGTAAFSLNANRIENQGGAFITNGDFSVQAKRVNNTQGTFFAGDQLSIDTQRGAFISEQGRLLAQGEFRLHTGALNNHLGLIQTGQNATINALSVQNDRGQILATQSADLRVEGAISQSRGTLSAEGIDIVTGSLVSKDKSVITADQVDIHSGVLDNRQSEISAAGSLTVTAQQLDNQQGLILSKQDNVTINTQQQALHNQQGAIIAEQQLSIASGDLDNTAGLLQSSGNASIRTHRGHLTNQQTKVEENEPLKGIVTLAELILQTQVLDNQQGYIASGNTQTVQATQFDNRQGVITAQAEQALDIRQAINNMQGRISGQGQTLRAQALDNSQGQLLSSQSQQITVVDGLNNKRGTIKAEQQLSAQANVVNNQQGYLGSVQGNLEIQSRQAMNNAQGKIEAKGKITLTAAGLDNTAGIVYAQHGDIQLDSQRQQLNNTQGEINSGGVLHIQSGALDNQQGRLYAQKKASINTQHAAITNTEQGKITSSGDLDLHTGHLNNQRGYLQAAQDMSLTVAADLLNNAIGLSGSFIQADGTLTINSDSIHNNGTQNSDFSRGIVANQLVLSTKALDNQQGGIYVNQRANLTIEQTVNNQQGDIISWGDLTLSGDPNRLRINNTEGKLQAENALTLKAQALTLNGLIEARHIDISLRENMTFERDINALSRLHIQTTGNISNNYKLSANDKLSLDAQNIDNQQNGRISSGHTRLTAEQTVNNTGLINSFNDTDTAKTVIKAQQINNIGSGRIYGDYVALQANQIRNTDNTSGSATIAARQRLDLAADEIINETTIYDADKKGGSTLYSGGALVFGATLNEKDEAQGNAGTLRNLSSIIEATTDIALNVRQIENKNIHYTTAIEETARQTVDETYIIPKGLAGGASPFNNPNSTLISTRDLYWKPFSRAGKWAHKSVSGADKVITTIEDITSSTLLVMPNDETCNADFSACQPNPAGQYSNSNPIWQYFGLSAPAEEQPAFSSQDFTTYLTLTHPTVDLAALSDDEYDALESAMKAPVIPVTEPQMPLKAIGESDEDYQVRVVQYQQDKYTYDNREALTKAYEKIRATHEWMAKYGATLEALNTAIEKHNGKIAGREYPDYWQLHVDTKRVEETVVKTTLPGQILAGGNIDYNAEQFVNDKSAVIAGAGITQSGVGSIANLDDPDAIHRDIMEGSRFYSYSRWRGGTKCYHQRKNNSHGALKRIDEKHKAMNLWTVDDYTAPSSSSSYIDVKNGLTQPDNAVDINGLTTFVTTEAEHAKTYNIGSTPFVSNLNAVNPPNQLQRYTATLADHEIRTVAADTRLPSQSLYKINPQADSHVLIETDPDFANRKQWLSSDYMYTALRNDHTNVHKRLGDGYYEQRLVREQINRLTGRNFLGEHTDYDSQYKALMDAGITFAQKFNLRTGIALTPAQVAQLTTDMVWLETQNITLADGTAVEVLVPKVYAVVKKGDVDGRGTLLSGNRVQINASEMLNQGTIAGREFVVFNANHLTNSGIISGGVVSGDVTGNVNNIGGTLAADRALLLKVGGDFNHHSTTTTTQVDLDGYQRKDTNLDRKALLYVRGQDGRLSVSAENINLNGADIINDGQGGTYLTAKQAIRLGTVDVGFDEKMGGGDHYRNQAVQDVVVSRVKSAGDTVLRATNIYSEGAQLESEQKLTALAENDLVLDTAARKSDYAEYHKTKSGSALGKSSKETFDSERRAIQQGSGVSAREVVLYAGQDLTATAANVVADNDVNLIAGRNVSVTAGVNQFENVHWEKKKKSGLMSSGGLGVTIGSQSQSHQYDEKGTTQSDARAAVGSLSGNVTIQAGNHVNILGTDLIAQADKAIDISGKTLKVEAGKDIIESSEKHEFKQSGLTVALSTPVTDAALAARQSLKRSGEVKDSRLAALYQVKAATEAAMAVQAATDTADTLGNIMDGAMQEGATSNPQVKISVSVGSSQSSSTSNTQQITHSGSELSAGNIKLKTTEGDIDILGSSLNATQIALDSARDIHLESVQDTMSNRSDNKNSGWNAGVFVGYNGNSYGFGLEASGQVGKGRENSDSTTQRNTVLNADNFILNSQNDTNIKGAVVNAKRLDGEIGGDLNIESRQDTNHYKGEQTQTGASVSVTYYGSGGGGSVNASLSKGKVNYAQVNEQSGIRVGEEGMDLTVGGNTHLKGGVIDSQATADKNRFSTGTLTTENIENHSEVSMQSVSVGMSTSGPSPMQAIGLAASLAGNVNKSDSSSTQSAVSSNINLEVRNGETPTALSRDTANANQKIQQFDKAEYQERLEAAQVIGDIAKNAVNLATYEERTESAKLKDRAKDAEKAGNKVLAAELSGQAAVLDEKIDARFGIGSTNGQAIAAVTAVLQGLAGGNAGQAIAGGLSPYVNSQIKELTGDDTEVNIVAHALWGAIEAKASGNNALAGATAAVSGEVAAAFLTKQLYGKAPKDLTASEKETISGLSQIVGALSGVAVANNSSDGYRGAEVAKSAVENNAFGMDVAGNLGVVMAREQENCDQECKQNLDKLLYDSHVVVLDSSKIVLGGALMMYAPTIMTNSSIISGGIGAGVEFGSQYISAKGDLSKIDYIDVTSSGTVGIITKNMGLKGIVTTNMIAQAGNSYRKGDDIFSNTLATGGTALFGALVGKGTEKSLDKIFNKNWSPYNSISSSIYPTISTFPEKSMYPSIGANVLDSLSSKSIGPTLNKLSGTGYEKK
ncbi:two-partner secretion domain-containing protein [Pasteurella testudinis]|uniref:two-partner secretion domain-containing protein n=1 Tax=Pasteurella testudinis TaxID=761 RepID=UPI004059FF3F